MAMPLTLDVEFKASRQTLPSVTVVSIKTLELADVVIWLTPPSRMKLVGVEKLAVTVTFERVDWTCDVAEDIHEGRLAAKICAALVVRTVSLPPRIVEAPSAAASAAACSVILARIALP